MIPSRHVYQLLLLGTAIGLGIATIGSDVINPQFLDLSILLTLGFDAAVLLLAVVDERRVRSGRAVVWSVSTAIVSRSGAITRYRSL